MYLFPDPALQVTTSTCRAPFKPDDGLLVFLSALDERGSHVQEAAYYRLRLRTKGPDVPKEYWIECCPRPPSFWGRRSTDKIATCAQPDLHLNHHNPAAL